MLWLTELGTRLKEARLSKGYSLDDLQEITKIQKRYLVGIEEGNYSLMPGTFYVRAFIKQYAEAVGLDPDEIFEEYKHEIPSHQTEEVAQSYSKSPTRKKLKTTSSSKMMESLPKYIFALFIIIILVVFWFLWSKKTSTPPDEQVTNDNLLYEQTPVETPSPNEDEKQDEDETENETNEEPAVDEQDEMEEPQQIISEGQVQPDGVSTIYELSGTETMNIRVEVFGDTWVSIRNENGEEQVPDRVYKQGEVVEHDSTENRYARIRLGFSQNAKVFVNEEEIQYVQNISAQNIIIKFSEEQ